MNTKKSRMPELGEAFFCIIYLAFDCIAAAVLFANAEGRAWTILFGILTLVLAGGDAFHLVPRICKTFRGEFPSYEFWAGLGLFISSVTMTAFYILLYYVWKQWYGATVETSPAVIWLLFLCAAVRILLCLFPQNNWLKKEGNPKWGIYRNVPFVVVGLIMIYLFWISGKWSMAIAILISFGCYLPVVLYAKKNPKIGMLMMPKTMAYMWMICIGLAML